MRYALTVARIRWMFPSDLSRHSRGRPSNVSQVPALLSEPPAGRVKSWVARRQRSNRFLRVSEIWQTAAPIKEQSFLGVCLVMSWLISAASLTGYVILAMFVLVALGRVAKHSCLALAGRLPQRSRSRHHVVTWVSAAFFSLLAVRACYIAAAIVDAEFRSNPIEYSKAE